MITAIVTGEATELTIATLEDAFLEKMGNSGERTKLTQGVNNVPVDAGVFRVLSKRAVRVIADTQNLDVVVSPNDKDGGPIELLRMTIPGHDQPEVIDLLSSAMGMFPPH